MNASKVKSTFHAGLFLAGALAFVAFVAASVAATGPAHAEEPTRLLPAGDTAPLTNGGILARESLGPSNPDGLGLLDPGHGGLPATLWANTDRREVLALLAALPMTGNSPARLALARRLLLTSAPPPLLADGKPQPPDAVTSSLLLVRLSRLLRMGATAEVRALLEALPPAAITEDMQRVLQDSYLIDNDTDRACALASAVNRQTTDPYWLKSLVFCDLLAGKRDKAALEISLLRETRDDDPVFTWASEQLAGSRSVTLAGFDNPQPLTMAMVRATKTTSALGYPAGTLVDAQPWVLRAAAKTKATSTPAEREAVLIASLTAARNGGLSVPELATVLAAVTLPPPAAGKPLEPAKTASDWAARPSPMGDAMLWQMANATTAPAQRAEVIVRALESANRQNWGLVAARLYAPLIQTVAPDPTLVGVAEPLTRAVLVAGNLSAAQAWYAMVEADQTAKGQESKLALWPLLRLVGAAKDGATGGKALAPEKLLAWQTQVRARLALDGEGDTHEPPNRRVKRLHTRLLSLLTALGEPVSLEEWSPLWLDPTGDAGFVPSASRWQGERLASRNQQSGATVALALMMLAGAEPGEESAMTVSSAIEGLMRVGLEAEARQIALEAAVAAGL